MTAQPRSATKSRIAQLALLADLDLKLYSEKNKQIIILSKGQWREEVHSNREAVAFLRGFIRGRDG